MFDFSPEPDFKDMIDKLYFDHSSEMSSWECEFINDMFDKPDDYEYSERQIEKVQEIYHQFV